MANERFTWERSVRDESDLPPTTRHVLLTLATYMKADGTGAYPTQATLAEACGLSERAVRKHLADAIAAGWIVKVRQGRHAGRGQSYSNEYAISDLWFWSAGGTPVPPGTVDNAPAGGTGVPAGNPQEARRSPQEARDDTAGGTGVPPITLNMHIEHRGHGLNGRCVQCDGSRFVGGERKPDGSLLPARACPGCSQEARTA